MGRGVCYNRTAIIKGGNDLKRAVIFDLDGTLLDTVASMAKAGNQMLADFGYPPRPQEEYRYFAGDGARCLVHRVLVAAAKEGLLDREEQAYQAYMRYFQDTCTFSVVPYAGILDLLFALQSRRMLLAVLSNKPHAQTLSVIQRYFAGDLFSIVQGQTEEIPKKPDPTGALAIAKRLSVLPSECLYVGDTNTDMQTGLAAGMETVGVLWGFRDRKELEENHAAHIVSNPMEILDLLG